jgi:uncharacterized RDD family membrane protein YckC
LSAVVLDTIVAAETPEGITIELRPAGLPVRFYAYSLDLTIRAALLIGLRIAMAPLGGMGLGLTFIFGFLLEWFYPVAFELGRWGATPGKRAFGLKVVMDNGLPVTPAASVARNLLRTVDLLPAVYGFGIVSMLVRSDFKRLGDLAAGTLVVYEPKRSSPVKLPDIEPMAPTRPLSPRDQAALIALATRAPRLTAERVDELAALAASVAGTSSKDPQATARVLAVAQWLLGRRG